MATLASTFIANVPADVRGPINVAGLSLEVWRIASGGASGDTCAITPQFTTDIRTVMTEVSTTNDLTTNANTNVTLTLRIGTNTATASDVWILGRRN